MKNNNIPTNLLEGLNIIEKRNSKLWLKTIFYFTIALVSTAALLFIEDSKSSVYMFAGIAAAFGYILGICVIIFSRKDTICDGKRLNGYTIFFDTDNASVEKAISAKDAKSLKDYKNSAENGLKLELAYSDDFSIARYRLYRYIPFEFQPDSEIIDINPEQAQILTTI